MKPAHLIIAYLPQNPRQPLKAIGEFQLDPALGVLVHGRRSYDPESVSDIDDMLAAQRKVGRSKRYQGQRVVVAPVGYFLHRDETLAASRSETARVIAADHEESVRLAALVAAAPETAPPKQSPSPATPEAHPDTEESRSPEADDVLPPYSEWSLADLKAEVAARGLAAPAKSKPKPAWIAVLEADDAADDAAE